ncbi:MAG: (4Fe-4S)-binding protein [Arachidicoccus sp.]|nr:(4Fe-4S)-binding protein [Arachidicoccus sp.]
MEKKEYTNSEITIVWQPKICIHSGVCARTLPNVYHPKEHPWITIEAAATDQIKNQIDKCPSGALSYYFNKEKI